MKRRVMLVAGLIVALCLGLAASASAACKAGQKVEVQWKGSWYPATVQKVKGEQCFIHYDGYGKSWDEWVGPDRIKAGSAPAVAAAEPAGQKFANGDAVQVNWKGKWWPAHVIASKKGQWKIHYDGYDNSWDEWVGPARIKK
jgi:hypothetical protein